MSTQPEQSRSTGESPIAGWFRPSPSGSPFTFVRLALAFTAFCVIAVSAGFLWYIYTTNVGMRGDLPLIIVRADDAPVKIRPETPGGIEIPNQDKLIFQGLTGTEPKVEQLLPGPELPLPVPGGASAGGGVTARNAPELSAPNTVTAPKPAPVMISPGVYMVQLGSFRERKAADRAWSALNAKHAAILATLKPEILSARVVNKGIFFRLKAGPLPSRDAADRLCRLLEQRGDPCLVVNP